MLRLHPCAGSKSNLLLKIHGLFDKEIVDLTRCEWTRQRRPGALFGSYPGRRDKALLLDIIIVNPCARSDPDNADGRAGKLLADSVERKNNKYRGSFPATDSSLALALWRCDEAGSDVHALIKELVIWRAEHSSQTHFEEFRCLAEGSEVARLRRQRLSFVQ